MGIFGQIDLFWCEQEIAKKLEGVDVYGVWENECIFFRVEIILFVIVE
jgi:hypothetical protein